MPKYDYSCPTHGTFEVFKPMSDTSDLTRMSCAKCGKQSKRLFSVVPAIFKCDGFYHIDSGKRFTSQLGPVGKEVYEKVRAAA